MRGSQACFWHTKDRFQSRHGIDLTREMYDGLILSILERRAQFVSRATKSRSFWVVATGLGKFLVLYSKRHKQIVTVYPSHKFKPRPAGIPAVPSLVKSRPIRKRRAMDHLTHYAND